MTEAQTSAGLANEPLSSLLRRRPVFVPRDASVAQAVDTMCRLNIGSVLVGTEQNCSGIFSERDLLFGIGETYDAVRDRPVDEFMTRNPRMLDADTSLLKALHEMASGGFRHLPVHRGGRPVGVVSLRDFLGIVNKWYPDLIG